MGNLLFLTIRDGARRLEGIGAGNPRLEAEYLMAAALGIPRIRLWLTDADPEPADIARFEALLSRRLAREPLQYVLGTVDFAGLTLEVGPGVFVPRSETEVLVDCVTNRLRAAAEPAPAPAVRLRHPPGSVGTGGAGIRRRRLIDVGTGSGAILLALLARFSGIRGVGVDRGRRAIAYASRNAQGVGLDDRATFVVGDLLAPFRPVRAWDAVVSNPPYVRDDEAPALSPEIQLHEPPEALFGGADGLDVIRRLVPEAAERLRPGGLLAIEIGITQGPAAAGMFRLDQWSDVSVEPDLAGRPRVLLARRKL